MPKKSSGSASPSHEGPALTAVEREAQEMLRANEEGEIDNVFDILEDMNDINDRLPAASTLRTEWDAFYDDCMKIVIDSAGG